MKIDEAVASKKPFKLEYKGLTSIVSTPWLICNQGGTIVHYEKKSRVFALTRRHILSDAWIIMDDKSDG